MRLCALLTLPIALALASMSSTHVDAQNGATSGAAAAISPRTSIALFRYRGAVPGSESFVQFEAFRGLLEQKIDNLRARLAEGGSGAVDLMFIDQLWVRPIDADEFQGNSQVQDWIRSERNVLEVLRGTILPTPTGVYSIVTRSHFIEDPSQNGMRVFKVELAFTPEAFADTRDAHSLILLYCIASEARRVGVPHDKLAMIVSDALNSIADLERRNGALQADMLLIKQAWQEFGNAL